MSPALPFDVGVMTQERHIVWTRLQAVATHLHEAIPTTALLIALVALLRTRLSHLEILCRELNHGHPMYLAMMEDAVYCQRLVSSLAEDPILWAKVQAVDLWAPVVAAAHWPLETDPPAASGGDSLE